MKTFPNKSAIRLIVPALVAIGLLGFTAELRAQLKSWSGTAGDGLWSTAGNWLPAGVPGAANNVTFTNDAATDQPLVLGGGIDNTVDAAFSGTIKSLWYANISGFHNTMLLKPLSVQGSSTNDVAFTADDGKAGALFVGSGQADAAADAVYASIGGESLTVTNPSAAISVTQASATSGAHRATLDLSLLGMFTCNVSNVLVGHDYGVPITRPTGTLILAVSNSITAKMLSVSDAYQNAGQISYVYLGLNNVLNVDRVRIASHKCIGTVAVQESVVGAAAVKMRASDGQARQTSWEIGDEYEPDTSSGFFTSNQSTGILDFSGANVDALVDRIVLGRGQTNAPTRTGDGNGTLIFGTGTINANQVEVGIQLSGGGSAGRGTLNINNDGGEPARLSINGDLIMGVQLPGNTEATGSTATINVNGGILEVGGNAIDGGGNVTMTISSGGTVDLMPDGTRGNIAVDTLNLSGGSLMNYGTLAVSTIAMSDAVTEFVVEQGETLSPAGDTVGTLNVTGGSLRLQGKLAIDVRKVGTTLSSDKIVGTVTYGGALEVRQLGDALAVGDKFTLFSAAIPANTFSSVTLPTPGAGLTFTNKLAIDGTIEVIASGEPTELPRLAFTQAGTALTISWPTAYTSYVLRGQTNTTGVSNNWGPVSGVAGNQVTFSVDPANRFVMFDLIKQ